MADRRDKQPAAVEVTDSVASPEASTRDSKLSWMQFFDNEKYRHHLMLIKTRQYKELLSVLRQGSTNSDNYKPPIELPSPEKIFPPCDNADDDITNSQSGVSLDFSVTSTYQTLSTDSTYSTQNSTTDKKHNRRLTIVLVLFGLIVLVAMSVTLGVILHVRLDKEESSLSRSRTDDVNNLEDVYSPSHQQSSTESVLTQQSSTSETLQWFTSSQFQNSQSTLSHFSLSPLTNLLSTPPMTVSSEWKPSNPQLFKPSTFALPRLSTTTLPSSFKLVSSSSLFSPTSKPVPQHYSSSLPNSPLSSLDKMLKSALTIDQPSVLSEILLQSPTPPVTRLSVLLLTQWSAPSLPSSNTHAPSLFQPAKQPLFHMTPPSQSHSSVPALPALSLSNTSSSEEATILTSSSSQSSTSSHQDSHMSRLHHLLTSPPATDSLSHMSVSSPSKPRSVPQKSTSTLLGLSPESVPEMYRSEISQLSLATPTPTLNIPAIITATPKMFLSTMSEHLLSKTERIYNTHNPHFPEQPIARGSLSSTPMGSTQSPGYDLRQPHLNTVRIPSSDSFGPGPPQLQLKSFGIPTSSDPAIVTLSDSLHSHFPSPVQSEWIQSTTKTPPRMLYSPSQISGPAKLSHPSSDGSHNYMSKMALPVTATQGGATALKSELGTNTTSAIPDEESQILKDTSSQDFTLSKIRTSLVDKATERPTENVFVNTTRPRDPKASVVTLLFSNARSAPAGESTQGALTSGVLTQRQDKSRISSVSNSAEMFKLRRQTSFPFALASTIPPAPPSLQQDEDSVGNISADITELVNMRRSNVSSSNNKVSTFGNPHNLTSSLGRLPNRQDDSIGGALETQSSMYPKRNFTVLTEQNRVEKYIYKLVNTTSTPQMLTATAAAIVTQLKKSTRIPTTNFTSSAPQITEMETDGDNPRAFNFNTLYPFVGQQNTNNNGSSDIMSIPQKMATARTHAAAINAPNVSMTTESGGSSIKNERKHVMSARSDTLSSDQNDATATSSNRVPSSSRRGVLHTNKDMATSYPKSNQNTGMNRTLTSAEADMKQTSMLAMALSSSEANVTKTTSNTKNNSNDMRTLHTSYGDLYNTDNMGIPYVNNMPSFASTRVDSNSNDTKVTPTVVGSAPSGGRDVYKTDLGISYATNDANRDNSSSYNTRNIFHSADARLATTLVPLLYDVANTQSQAAGANRDSALVLASSNQMSISDLKSIETSNQPSIDTIIRQSMDTPDLNHQSKETSNQHSKGTSYQQLIETLYKQSTEMPNYQPIGASTQLSTETLNYPLRGSTNQQWSTTSNQHSIETLNQQSTEALHQQFIGTSNEQSNGTSSQQSNGTSNQHSLETSHQQITGISHQLSKQTVGTSNEHLRRTSNQQSIERQNQSLGGSIDVLPTGSSSQQSNGSTNLLSKQTSNQQTLGILNQQSRETFNQPTRKTSNQQDTITSNNQTMRPLNQTSVTTSRQQFRNTGNVTSTEKPNQQSLETFNQQSTTPTNQHTLGRSNQQFVETSNQHSSGPTNQNSTGILNQQSRKTSSHKLSNDNSNLPAAVDISDNSTSQATSNKTASKSRVTSIATEDEDYVWSTKSPSYRTIEIPNTVAGRTSESTSKTIQTLNTVAGRTPESMSKTIQTLNTVAGRTPESMSKTIQTLNTVAGRTPESMSKTPLPATTSGSVVTSVEKIKYHKVPQTKTTTKESSSSGTTSDRNISTSNATTTNATATYATATTATASTATTTTATTTTATTTTLDPFASYQGVGNPDGGSGLSLSDLEKDGQNPGVLLDYSLLLQSLPPPEILPKAMATKIAAKPPPIPTVAPPLTPKPPEIKIIAPDVVAEIGMSPTSNLKVVCTAQKAWGWTYIAISRYEGDSEFSLEFLGGVDKSDEWPFIPIDSRMSDFTLHRDDDQVVFALETKYALCEDKGRYLCEVKVNRTFFSKTFNVDVKKRPEQPDLTFPDDVIEGQSIYLVTTWDAGNPVIGYIVHDIVQGFTGLPYASTSESSKAWYKDCAVMIENKYSVTPELSWNGTEIIAHILPKENATVYERSIVERVKYDRKILTVLDKKICDGQTNVRIAHPYRSDKYITCFSSGPSVTTCPDKHVFDEIMKFCVLSQIRH